MEEKTSDASASKWVKLTTPVPEKAASTPSQATPELSQEVHSTLSLADRRKAFANLPEEAFIRQNLVDLTKQPLQNGGACRVGTQRTYKDALCNKTTPRLDDRKTTPRLDNSSTVRGLQTNKLPNPRSRRDPVFTGIPNNRLESSVPTTTHRSEKVELRPKRRPVKPNPGNTRWEIKKSPTHPPVKKPDAPDTVIDIPMVGRPEPTTYAGISSFLFGKRNQEEPNARTEEKDNRTETTQAQGFDASNNKSPTLMSQYGELLRTKWVPKRNPSTSGQQTTGPKENKNTHANYPGRRNARPPVENRTMEPKRKPSRSTDAPATHDLRTTRPTRPPPTQHSGVVIPNITRNGDLGKRHQKETTNGVAREIRRSDDPAGKELRRKDESARFDGIIAKDTAVAVKATVEVAPGRYDHLSSDKKKWAEKYLNGGENNLHQHPLAANERAQGEQECLNLLDKCDRRKNKKILDVGGNPKRHFENKRKNIW